MSTNEIRAAVPRTPRHPQRWWLWLLVITVATVLQVYLALYDLRHASSTAAPCTAQRCYVYFDQGRVGLNLTLLALQSMLAAVASGVWRRSSTKAYLLLGGYTAMVAVFQLVLH